MASGIIGTPAHRLAPSFAVLIRVIGNQTNPQEHCANTVLDRIIRGDAGSV
jgi:hypothetical protein